MGRLLEKPPRITGVCGRHDLNAVALRKGKLALPIEFCARARDLLRTGLPSGGNGTRHGNELGQLDRAYLVRKIESYIGLTLAQTAHLIPHPTI